MSARVHARQERAQLQADVLARARELGFPQLVALAAVQVGARVKPKPIASGEGPWRRHIKTASRAELRTTLQRLGVFDRTARRAVRQLEAGEPVRITPQTIDVAARVLGLVQKSMGEPIVESVPGKFEFFFRDSTHRQRWQTAKGTRWPPPRPSW